MIIAIYLIPGDLMIVLLAKTIIEQISADIFDYLQRTVYLIPRHYNMLPYNSLSSFHFPCQEIYSLWQKIEIKIDQWFYNS